MEKNCIKIKKDLERVIKGLEYMQEEEYSPQTSFVLSYLYDIRDGTVPKMITDKIKNE